MNETRSANLKPFPKWNNVLARFEKQSKIPDQECGNVQYHPCAIVEWRVMLDALKQKPLRRQLEEVNEWANAHPYVVDQLNWGVEDFWETPGEFMSVNGDCEDYAITKYYSLRALGIGEERLRIIVLQDLNLGGIIHAVLGVYDGDELIILDNQIKQVRPASRIYHYRPIYGINASSWWVYTPR